MENDRAIESKKDDLLNRAKFAENFARNISEWKKKDNLVIGVYGEWGSGKSSVKNMIVECLKDKDKTKVIQFNPWEWQEQQVIAKELFNQIQIELSLNKDKRNKKQIEKAIRNLKKYAFRLRIAATILRPFGKLSKWVSAFLGAIAIVPFLTFINGYSAWFLLVSVVIFAIIGLSDYLISILNIFLDYLILEENKSLQAIKEEVAESLKSLDSPIVMMIDDIDRLNKHETKALFQIIKANSDFPNLIYVLFFQRDVVENHLQEDGISGTEYLKKIIQVPFELPKPSKSVIHNFLTKQLIYVLNSNESPENTIIKNFQEELTKTGIYKYFNNLRDVKRFISVFIFQAQILKTNGVLEVDFIDLIVLEVIRQYEPKFYNNIYNFKIDFTSNLSIPQERDRITKLLNSHIEDAIKDSGNSKEHLESVTCYLFPNLEWCFSSPYARNIANFPPLRLCHPDFFDRYFQLHLSEDDISQEEIEKSVANAGNLQALQQQFRMLYQTQRLDLFIYRFSQFTSKIVGEKSTLFIAALFDIGDKILFPSPYPITAYATIIIDKILKEEKNKEKKLFYILNALKNTEGTYLPLAWIDEEIGKIKNPSPYAPNFREEDIQSLHQAGLDILYRARDSRKLASLQQLGFILIKWAEFGDEVGANRWVETLIMVEEGIIRFLCGISYYGWNIKQNVRKYIDPELQERFINFDELVSRVKAIDTSKLNAEEKDSIAAFFYAYEARKPIHSN